MQRMISVLAMAVLGVAIGMPLATATPAAATPVTVWFEPDDPSDGFPVGFGIDDASVTAATTTGGAGIQVFDSTQNLDPGLFNLVSPDPSWDR